MIAGFLKSSNWDEDVAVERFEALQAELKKHEAAIKRSAELEAAALEEQAKCAHGAARAAKRARIASRPVKEGFALDNCGRRM